MRTDDASLSLPNVWGAGQLLAFSGVDGPVDWHGQLVLHTGETPGALSVKLPIEAEVAFEGVDGLRWTCVLGDAVVGESGRGGYAVSFTDSRTAIGRMPGGAAMVVAGQTIHGGAPVRVGEQGGVTVWAAAEGERWALLTQEGDDPAAATAAMRQALAADLDETLARRSAFVRELTLPEGLGADEQRLLRKAASVIKVNIMSPTERIRRHWTTPDRWPHRFMWLWDSAFQSVGLSYLRPKLAQETLLAMLDEVEADGFLPHTIYPAGEKRSDVTQPPILAWAVEHVARRTDDRDFAAACAGPLRRYLDWNRQHRDPHGTGLFEWVISGDPLCRSGESGLDNSPRFDRATALGAVDFCSFMAHDYACLAKLYRQLGDESAAETCDAEAKAIGDRINALLWDEEAGLYMDRHPEGGFSPVKAVSGFLPLFAGVAGPAQAQRLREQLVDPATFGTPCPVPSVALDEGTFCKDMWRGPSWVNMNWLITLGLQRYGFEADADRLRDATLAMLGQWYRAEGCLFEYYDSLGVTSPRGLDRKQRLATGRGIAPISDYHWTASAAIALAFEAAAAPTAVVAAQEA